jgi:phenylacetate-CoA ligase
MDEMIVHAEARNEAWGQGDLSAQGDRLVARIKSAIGVSTRVVVHAPDTIERTLTGKAKRVVDNRPKA